MLSWEEWEKKSRLYDDVIIEKTSIKGGGSGGG